MRFALCWPRLWDFRLGFLLDSVSKEFRNFKRFRKFLRDFLLILSGFPSGARYFFETYLTITKIRFFNIYIKDFFRGSFRDFSRYFFRESFGYSFISTRIPSKILSKIPERFSAGISTLIPVGFPPQVLTSTYNDSFRDFCLCFCRYSFSIVSHNLFLDSSKDCSRKFKVTPVEIHSKSTPTFFYGCLTGFLPQCL